MRKKAVSLISTNRDFSKSFVSIKSASWWLKEDEHCIYELLSRGITHIGEFEIVVGGMDR